MRIPIGIKLNTIIIAILVVSFVSILFLATMLFQRDNRNYINSLNSEIAKANAEKVNSTLRSVVNGLSFNSKDY